MLGSGTLIKSNIRSTTIELVSMVIWRCILRWTPPLGHALLCTKVCWRVYVIIIAVIVIHLTLNVPSLLLKIILHLIPLLLFLLVTRRLLMESIKPVLQVEVHSLLIPKCLHQVL